MSFDDLIIYVCLGIAIWYVPRYLLRVYAPGVGAGLRSFVRAWWQHGVAVQQERHEQRRARYEERAVAYGLRDDVNTYDEPPAPIMFDEAPDEPQTAQTDRQTSVSVADQWLDRIEVDRTRAALIELLVYSDWQVGEIRAVIKGDNGTIGTEVEAARKRLEVPPDPPRLLKVNNERFIPLDERAA